MPDPIGLSSTNAWWLQATDALEHFFTTVGIIIGGVWTYVHFIRRREHETALQIALVATSEPHDGDKWLTFFDVRFTNKGRVKLVAKKKQPLAYDDHRKGDPRGQKFDYGVDLQVWQVPDSKLQVLVHPADDQKRLLPGDIEPFQYLRYLLCLRVFQRKILDYHERVAVVF